MICRYILIDTVGKPETPVGVNVTSGSTSLSLKDIDARSREVFKQIVESYLETGEPVGSRNLSRLLPMALSPASVRNVMADLEQLGLIFAPHISAGRLPTEQGLRFFVDALLEVGDLNSEERKKSNRKYTAPASITRLNRC